MSIVIYSCINNKKTSAVIDGNERTELKTANIIGTYSGNLPCVDCDAIKTVLQLNRDYSYKLVYFYEGKSNDAFVKEGSWELDKNKLILNGIDYAYKVVREGLYQLDLSGNEITGDLADNYQLAKVN